MIVESVKEKEKEGSRPQETPQAPPAAFPAPTQPQSAPPSPPKQSKRLHMQQIVGLRKQERINKVLTHARDKRSIKNDDVQKLLRVSDATATNYLRELVKKGKLRKTGVGKGTKYEPL